MLEHLKTNPLIKRLRKTRWYCRFRANFSPPPQVVTQDPTDVENADLVQLAWPPELKRPVFGLVQDFDKFPHWTKYRRFLKNNNFEYEIYNIHAQDWLERAQRYDVVVGFSSCELWHVQELREKYFFLEKFMGKRTYPSPHHIMIYEDKKLEAYIASAADLPFARTHVSYDFEDALQLAEQLRYPVVSKIVPSSASVGTELLNTPRQARKVVQQAFSPHGRRAHTAAFRQKNYVYFQEYIPNDGYDIRVMVTGNCAYGYYRKVPGGDFRASGMGLVEKRALPEEAMRIALRLNSVVKSPMLVVDFVHALNGKYYIIEYSPVCQMETPEQLHVGGVPGAYVWEAETGFRFCPGRHWLHELALREFLVESFFPHETLRTRLNDTARASGCGPLRTMA